MLRFALLVVSCMCSWSVLAAPGPGRLDSLRRVARTAPDTAAVLGLLEWSRLHANPRPQQSLLDAQLALQAARRLRWPHGTAAALERTGEQYAKLDNYPQAQQLMFEALAQWEKLGDQLHPITISHNLGVIMEQTNQLEKAIAWQRKTVRLATAAHDTLSLAQSLASLAVLSASQRRFEPAVRYNQQALRLMSSAKHDATKSVVLNNQADVYMQMAQFERALPYLKQAQTLATRLNHWATLAMIEGTLAQTYQGLGQLPRAVRHARESHRLAQTYGAKSILVQICELLATLYRQQGDYRHAYQYAEEQRRLELAVRSEQQLRAVSDLQLRYESEQQAQAIKLLTQRNEIQRLAALQQRTLRNAALLVSVLLLLAVGVLYNRYRQRQRTVGLLNEQNREKTLLLQEVHHRVKNNLQIVLSLLDAQLYSLQDAAALEAIRESQSRVQSMALLHQHLYQSESLAQINLSSYLTELLATISAAYRAPHVHISLDVAPVQLTTQTAVPLGLIVNELVTNAYKYAFGGGGPGELSVSVLPAPAGGFCLRVADNGPGLPPLHLDTVQSLGLRLTVGLVRQLHATLHVERRGGTTFQIHFRDEAAAPGAAARRPALAAAV